MKRKVLYILILILVLSLAFLIFINYYYPQDLAEANKVVVFVIDTQIEERYLSNDNIGIAPDISHGSLVSWIIRQKSAVKIKPIKVAEYKDQIVEDLYLAGLEEIIAYKKEHPQKQVLVNISLGFTNKESQQDLIKKLNQLGVLIIAAAGNNNQEQAVYPAGFKDEVIAVANGTRKGKAISSNYGDFVDLTAPGSIEHISQLYLANQRFIRQLQFEGTSFAAPRVTGLIAKLLLIDPNLTAHTAVQLLQETARPIKSDLFLAGKLGAGVINKYRAIYRVDKIYLVRILLKAVSTTALFLLIIIFLLSKDNLLSFILLFVFSLVIIPSLVMIDFRISFFLNLISKENISIIILSIIFSFLLSFWPKKRQIFIYSYLLFFVSILLSLNEKFIILFPLTSLLFILIEKILNYLLLKSNDIILLVRLLACSSSLLQKNIKTRFIKADLKQLLTIAKNNKYYGELIINSLINWRQKELKPVLINYFKNKDIESQNLAAEIIKKLEPEQAICILKKLLQQDNVDKFIILKSLAFFADKAQDTVEVIVKILEDSQDMWVRFQAIRTLIAINTDLDILLPLLNKLKDDQHELVRLEVRDFLNKEHVNNST